MNGARTLTITELREAKRESRQAWPVFPLLSTGIDFTSHNIERGRGGAEGAPNRERRHADRHPKPRQGSHGAKQRGKGGKGKYYEEMKKRPVSRATQATASQTP